MNWEPIGDQVLVKQHAKQDKTKSGIILVDRDMNFKSGTIVAVGDGLFTQTGDRIPMTVKEDQEVMIHSNQIGDHKEVTIDGEKYQLVRESEIALIKQ